MKPVISTTELFYALGQAERLTREATAKAHKDYTKSTPEQQEQLMHDCIAQFIMGYTGCTLKAAERILSQSRGDRTKKAQDAYYKGYSKFRYHIIRADVSETTQPESHARVAVPKAKVEAAVKLFDGLTRPQIDALVKRALSQIEFK